MEVNMSGQLAKFCQLPPPKTSFLSYRLVQKVKAKMPNWVLVIALLVLANASPIIYLHPLTIVLAALGNLAILSWLGKYKFRGTGPNHIGHSTWFRLPIIGTGFHVKSYNWDRSYGMPCDYLAGPLPMAAPKERVQYDSHRR